MSLSTLCLACANRSSVAEMSHWPKWVPSLAHNPKTPPGSWGQRGSRELSKFWGGDPEPSNSSPDSLGYTALHVYCGTTQYDNPTEMLVTQYLYVSSLGKHTCEISQLCDFLQTQTRLARGCCLIAIPGATFSSCCLLDPTRLRGYASRVLAWCLQGKALDMICRTEY